MDRVLYVSTTGAAHLERAQAIHANNLANASTVGFRADLAQARAMQAYGDGHPARVYALTETPGVDFAQAPLIETGRSLDVAISGKGFIAVLARDGTEAYTRAGSLTIDAAGQLTTATGQRVLGSGGPIALPPYESVTIGRDGSISVHAQGTGPENLVQVDRIKLVRPDVLTLVKGADGLFRRNDGATLPASAEVGLVSGALEQSNVNAVTELTAILSLARQFELEVKMMQTAKENDEAAASLVRIS